MLSRALLLSTATSACATMGNLEDVEHIVIWMQENRAFDHYYGTMRGVRGFHDRAAPTLPSGKSPFHQPTSKDPATAADEYQLPYPVMFNTTSACCMAAPEMDYITDIRMWNGGKMDGWNSQRKAGFGMSYFNRSDLPYYYSLIDAFTIGDQYFQSTFTATDPNRFFLFSGSNGLSEPNSSTCILDDSHPTDNKWETMPETLEKANISWRIYQERDNFNDNALAWFDTFSSSKAGEKWYDKGMYRGEDVVEEFRADVASGNLPQVSWIVGPAALSEHAHNHPQDGQDLSARLINVLKENPEVYAKTVFILNYDEGGQFYDHHWVPTPPVNDDDGKSTVTTEGEITKEKPYDSVAAGLPIGPGFRVPLVLISPWSRGGYVYSEVTDHASVVKFVEKRFGVRTPNMSPWRRAVVGDLTAAFDFANPDYSWPQFPNTSADVNQSKWQCENLPSPEVPKEQVFPVQEPGTRPSRALPYDFDISDTVSHADGTVQLKMVNAGGAGAVFHVFDLLALASNPADFDPAIEVQPSNPKKYTIEAGKELRDVWHTTNTSGKYHLSLHGPNGFVRQFAGDMSSDPADLTASFTFNPNEGSVWAILTGDICNFTIVDNAYGAEPYFSEYPTQKTMSLTESGNWYDLSVTAGCAPSFSRRIMGRMETGSDSISDPAMAVAPAHNEFHPPMPEAFRHISNRKPAMTCRASFEFGVQHKDMCWGVESEEQMVI